MDIYLKELDTLKKQECIECRSLTILAFNILGLINWRMRWYRPDGPLSFEETVEEILSFVLHGMLRSDSSARKSCRS